MRANDEFWILRCFELAKQGAGRVSPNPLVGAILVYNGKIISEGYHQHFGGPHAEINAINQALKQKKKLKGSTLYVNLEPCFHFGKTPPCVDAILKQGISRVVIASKDPNPLVAGKSVRKLRRNGVDCTIGILQNDAERLNEIFFKFIKNGLPFVAIKAAQTVDGFIAKVDGTSKWITNEQSRKYVHKLRSEYDAVLVGAQTVCSDNPELTVRSVRGRNPIRILLDGKLIVDPNSKIFNSKASTIVYTTKKQAINDLDKIRTLENKGIVVVQLRGRKGILQLNDMMSDLGSHHISSVFVEGGQKIYSQFLNSEAVDKVYLFTAKKKFGNGIKTFKDITKPILLSKYREQKFGNNILEEFDMQNSKREIA